MKIIIDRFEENYAVIELPDGQFTNAPRELFPSAKEGDIYTICKEENETISRERLIRQKFDSLRED